MEYCFGNSSFHPIHTQCYLKKKGAVKIIPPEIVEIASTEIAIVFNGKVYAKDFAAYWGALEKEFISDKRIGIIIDLSKTIYMNLFCISKILLSIFDTDKRVKIIWPKVDKKIDASKHKMLRYFYNLGIIELLFNKEACTGIHNSQIIYTANNNISNFIGTEEIDSYHSVYDFSQCKDKSVKKYQVFKLSYKKKDTIDDNILEEIYNRTIFPALSEYYKGKINVLNSISERIQLYFTEIAGNIFEHAYTNRDSIIFSIVITNDYLPEYAHKGKNRKKFDERVDRIEQEIPKYVFGAVEERYFGGLSLFIDDIGKGIAHEIGNPYEYGALYNKIFRDGIPETERSKGKTAINGLKLVFDQISDYNDHLWIHDCHCWVGSFFADQERPELVDNSYSRGLIDSAKDYYSHPCISGLTYEIRINFSFHSPNKETVFNTYGSNVNRDLEQLREILSHKYADLGYPKYLVIDKYNPKNLTKSWAKEIEQNNYESIIFRPIRLQKDKISYELKTCIIDKIQNAYKKKGIKVKFETLFIVDLTHTQVFQMRAVIETSEISHFFINTGVNNIILVSRDFYLFAMHPNANSKFVFSGTKQNSYSSKYALDNQVILNELINILHYTDSSIFVSDSRLIKQFMLFGEINWSGSTLDSYLDVEGLMSNHKLFEILLKFVVRLDGLLGKKVRIQFFEDFMKHKFMHFINAFKESNAVELYIGSIVYSQKTQRKAVATNSQVVYFFRHNQSSTEVNNNIYLLDYPLFKQAKTKSKTKYRRVIYSNKVETYGSDSNILKYYTGSVSPELLVGDYKEYLLNLSYDVGFFKDGLFRVDVNQALFSTFEKYIIDQLVLISNEHRNICINIEYTQLKNSIDFEEVIKSVKNRTLRFQKLVKISCNQNDFSGTAYVNVFIYYSATILDLLAVSKENNPIIITLFNQLELNTSFDKLIDSKYMAFIPIRVISASTLGLKHIGDIVLKLQNSLAPVFRDGVKLFSNTIVEKDEWGITNDVELGNLFREEFRQILFECIQLEINRSMSIGDENEPLSQFDFLVELLTLSSGSLLLYRGTISQSISLFDKFLNVISELISNEQYEESTITFYIVILAYALDLHKEFSLLLTEHDQLYGQKVVDAFIKCNSTLYKILLASILKETDEKNIVYMLIKYFIITISNHTRIFLRYYLMNMVRIMTRL